MLVVALAASACEEKAQNQGKAESAKADAGASRPSGVDKNIAEAVAEVAGGGGSAQAGPPESGVFAPGVADREARAGDPPKLVLGGKGSGATVQFAAPKPSKKSVGRVTVAIQTGPSAALPTIELSFAFEPGSGSSPPSEAAATPSELVARVTSAKPAAEQPGRLPPDAASQIARFKGSRIRIALSPSGGGRITAVEPAKDLDPGLAPVLGTAADALALDFLPYPREPVGTGAYWMITNRESFAGLDVVSYRMVKLESIEKDTANLSLSTKRYVAGGQIGLGVPPHKVDQFAGNAQGHLTVVPSDPSVVRGSADDSLLANLTATGGAAPGQPGQKIQVHLEMHSELAVSGG
jgi:hypothetical protein